MACRLYQQIEVYKLSSRFLKKLRLCGTLFQNGCVLSLGVCMCRCECRVGVPPTVTGLLNPDALPDDFARAVIGAAHRGEW